MQQEQQGQSQGQETETPLTPAQMALLETITELLAVAMVCVTGLLMAWIG